MDMGIGFPNLNIFLSYVPKTISINGFDIAFYGIIIGLGMILGIFLADYDARKNGAKNEMIWDLSIYLLAISIIGARLYYVIFSWDNYKDDLFSIFNIREGGLAIFGGVIAGALTLFFYTKIKKISFFMTADSVVLGLLTGQILGRWGNFFNREAFGDYTNNLFAMQLPVSAVRANEITAVMEKHIESINGIQYIQVHPTFLYESVWNLCVLIFLLVYRKHKAFQGEIFMLYLMFYGLGRFFIEALRTDQLLIWNTNLPVSRVLAFAICVFSSLFITYKRIKIKKLSKQ
ncbi:phosphatidylglycerol:prolipoprotein diacylglycerol transferase [Acetitomaculum ruminis DSM 5522]|uniref:Phosphatidylglycerol--prolipoprotein diacylglyceryl transferase n=1 Tax=Acetitomaculum ruminis DSM 5522 TaxID=1120918 RepID=A0A1I0VWL8_9FIRM|nr:prolipoprotein diacylglyceryl transferase [Acetitomaculum ruminis]SFA80293.1 phosphatidylglycerol:prolipoprotein diacylglycerol transferase [Acetitomaculum ruminis DSM 5522]